jgi:hypothetical protein
MPRTYHGFFPVKTLNGGEPALAHVPLVSAIYEEGNVLRLKATTGSATKAAAAGTALLGALACSLTAAQSLTGKHPVYLFDGNTVFQATRIATGLSKLSRFDKVDLAVASTYNFRIQGTASTEAFTIYDVHPDDETSQAANVRYYVLPNPEVSIIREGHNTL